MASGQGQLTMQAERPSASFSGSNPSAQPEPLFPQHNAPPASSQALALSSHAHQPHPPQSQQQYGSPVLQQKQSLLGDSSHTPTNVSSSPHSASAVSDGLLGRSPGLLKPHALLESLQPTVRPKSPANVPMSLDSGRYGPMRGNMRPPFRPQGVEERERDLRFQKRGTGISEPPRPHPPTERSQGQGNYNEWDQGPPQSRGEIPTGPRAPTEEMFSEPKQEEQFDHHQQQHQDDQQQHFGEHPFKAEPEYKWQSNKEGRQGELAHDFQHSTQEQEWGVYGSGQNRASEHLKIDKENIRGPSPYGHHQFPYNERGDAITSSPAVSISSLKSDEPTISSLRKDAITAIPGLGGGFEEQEKDAAKSAESSSITGPQSTQQVAKGGEGGEGTGTAGGNQANQMIKSLGKFVSQLQTLKGLTSSLQLLQALPKGGNGEEEAKRVEPAKPKESSEAELSEETKRKVAALLATESDSDGEQVIYNVIITVESG